MQFPKLKVNRGVSVSRSSPTRVRRPAAQRDTYAPAPRSLRPSLAHLLSRALAPDGTGLQLASALVLVIKGLADAAVAIINAFKRGDLKVPRGAQSAGVEALPDGLADQVNAAIAELVQSLGACTQAAQVLALSHVFDSKMNALEAPKYPALGFFIKACRQAMEGKITELGAAPAHA